ncbi:MAG: acyl-CoA carboxylase subunit beta [Pseudomonadota bacterium]
MNEMQKKIAQIEALRETIKMGGGEAAIEKQHARGKLTARERLEKLFDPGTFTEFDAFAKHMGRDYGLDKVERVPADGVVTGYGDVNGRKVFAYSEDFTVIAGTFGEMHGRKIAKTVELACKMNCPVVGMNDSGGARVTEEMGALSQYGQLFFRHVRASGVVPQIALVMGPVAGGQAYSPALMDFIFMVDKSSTMFIAGPPLVEAIVHEKISAEDLGGARMHARTSGVSDLTCADDAACIEETRRLLSFLPSSNQEDPPIQDSGDDPERRLDAIVDLVPAEPNKFYDMHKVIELLVDNGDFFELKAEFARNMIIGLGRLGGRTVGIVANNPMFMAGSIDHKAAVKAARFIRFCDQYEIPLINLQDVPGFLIGSQSEKAGIIRHGSKMLYAYAESTVPKITVVLRKSYAGGYLAMCSKDLGADFVFEFPCGEICLMGPQGAVNILFRKELKKAKDAGEDVAALRETLNADFHDRFVNPLYSAGLQHVDDIIDPRDMRKLIHRSLDVCRMKRDELPPKKHGNIPI